MKGMKFSESNAINLNISKYTFFCTTCKSLFQHIMKVKTFWSKNWKKSVKVYSRNIVCVCLSGCDILYYMQKTLRGHQHILQWFSTFQTSLNIWTVFWILICISFSTIIYESLFGGKINRALNVCLRNHCVPRGMWKALS